LLKLSVIIVNYNVHYFLEQCLRSVLAAAENIEVEIIVVDNNSSDGSQEMIEQKFPEVRVISNKDNVGFSKANNQGVTEAKGEYILILNPDTVLAEDTIELVLNFAETKDKLGVIGVQFIDGTGKLLPECKRNIPTLKIASEKLFGKSANYYANQIDENEIAKVDILTGAFMLIKRSVFNKVSGFDEDYFMFGEDIDLSYKILNAGYQNYYFGESTILHYKGESTVKDISYLKNFYGAMQLFYKSHFIENKILNFAIKMAFRFLVVFRSFKNKTTIPDKIKVQNIIFISDNNDMFQRIVNITKEQHISMSGVVSTDLSDFDMIILDNSYLTNKEIIKAFKSIKHSNLSKRIIPRNSNFYLGSDSSTDRGEVMKY
jgi:GT2 family glycosyltransferase